MMFEFADVAISLLGVLAARPDAEMPLPCRVELLDAQGVRALDPVQWDGLAINALEDNPWLGRQMVLAGLDAYGGEKGFRALALFRRGTGELIGFLPFRTIGLGGWSIGRPALNLYQVGGIPLIARDQAQVAMLALLGVMSDGKGLPRHWLFPHVVGSGPFAVLARSIGKRLGLELSLATPYSRPFLTHEAGDFASHVAEVIGRKRARDIERNLRRLEKLGRLEFERVSDAEMVARRVEDFLRIEASGWKGHKGTALLSSRTDTQFARAAFGGTGEASGLATIDSLLLDGEPIAVSINISAGATLFTPKCAFDERYRKYGPGMALEYKVVEAFFDQTEHRAMDAATTVDGHAVEGLWGQSREMGTLVIGPRGPATTMLAAVLERYRATKDTFKKALGRG
ncbi:GNAT family N-acetyltransferase [Pelagibacterium lacus]|uniref:GNAT family N-acetyltransferase n=1 Tax=Pelagibacterium lacus TaxID=2282655 RepID=A0A369W377_9HYPH|nr:GNAT family N-acetyltransferase [Pelagibacterium lacus]RDE08803.1 GNAT family N-acetyltransferase [Pelagibacterium lacus]